ncbi:hypothetical protein ALMP_29050 [Streptomyces sp. A012304]|nr:hypothetical protein ALMP_29050 [Streptomyces sp. A012304]
MKKVLVGVAAAVAFLGGAGTAVADAWHDLPDMRPIGVHFHHGEYRFNPPERNHGAFEWIGQLKDDMPNDGHNVYMLARAEAHAWSRYNGQQRRTVSMTRGWSHVCPPRRWYEGMTVWPDSRGWRECG